MSISRKWPIARAVVYDEDGTIWIAESRAGTGTWIIREDEDAELPQDEEKRDYHVYGIKGAFFGFSNEHEGVLLYMTKEQRENLGMGDDVYQQLNIDLDKSYEEQQQRKIDADRAGNWTADTDPRATLSRLPPPPPATPDVLEGFEFDHQGIRFRRENQGWVAVSVDVLDQAARASVGIKEQS